MEVLKEVLPKIVDWNDIDENMNYTITIEIYGIKTTT
jgi:hypothetical protein